MGEMAGPISPCGYPLLIPILKLDGCTRIQMHILVTQLLVFVIYLSYDAEKWWAQVNHLQTHHVVIYFALSQQGH